MNLLLDTHVLLWWLADSSKLSASAREVIADNGNVVIVSAATIWEIRIKQALGKLEIAPNYYEVIAQQGFEMLSISPIHAHAVGDLAAVHRDPFDRMLITQAKLEGLTIVTHDAVFKEYDVPILFV